MKFINNSFYIFFLKSGTYLSLAPPKNRFYADAGDGAGFQVQAKIRQTKTEITKSMSIHWSNFMHFTKQILI